MGVRVDVPGEIFLVVHLQVRVLSLEISGGALLRVLVHAGLGAFGGLDGLYFFFSHSEQLGGTSRVQDGGGLADFADHSLEGVLLLLQAAPAVLRVALAVLLFKVVAGALETQIVVASEN